MGVKKKQIITNPSISEFEERYIHTLDKVSRGDLVTIESESYLCITESLTKRGCKYKTLARHCNGTVDVMSDSTFILKGNNPYTGEPIYEEVPGEMYHIPALVDNKSFSADFNQPIVLPENEIN